MDPLDGDAEVTDTLGADRRAVVLAGHLGDGETARRGLSHDDPEVRVAALGALARIGVLEPAHLERALADPSAAVRRRAAELGAGLACDLGPAFSDAEPLVVEAACWAAGEREDPAAVDVLVGLAGTHDDPLVREAAVAALGAIGDDRGLAAILAATRDKPTVRRRAVLALAPFDGPDVDAALERAKHDRDWQVRQAAEDLTS